MGNGTTVGEVWRTSNEVGGAAGWWDGEGREGVAGRMGVEKKRQ